MSKYAKEIEELVGKMTLEEKVAMCHASTMFTNGGVERLGIPKIRMSDGPNGVREEVSDDTWDAAGRDDDFSTCLPCGEALAATWDKEMGQLYGQVLGSEARERRKDVILGPGVNMVKNPLCGRNFEYMGEDPYLAGTMATEEIKAIQKEGTGACIKHFALNSQEWCRFETDSRCDERTLREIYLAAFEKAVKEAKPATLMGAYNKFNGQHSCHNHVLLTQILRDEWGYEGAVVSDWGGVHDTFEAARTCLDLEMGTPVNGDYSKYFLSDAFLKALENGEVDEEFVNKKVRNILNAMFEIGIIGDKAKTRPNGERETPAHFEASRKIAEAAAVLLKNDKNFLPLDAKKMKKILVVGDNATRMHCHDGGSSNIKTRHEVNLLEGLQNFFKGTDTVVDYVKGYPSNKTGNEFPSSCMGVNNEGAGTRGWTFSAEYKDMKTSFPVTAPEFHWEEDLPKQFKGTEREAVVRFDGDFTPDKTGLWTFYLEGVPQSSFLIDGKKVIGAMTSSLNFSDLFAMELKKGETKHLTVLLCAHPSMPHFTSKLTVAYGDNTVSSDELAKKAKDADAVIFCGGLSHLEDAEGADKRDMELHYGQNAIIEQLAKLNENLVVLLNGGSPFAMPWIDKVPAVMLGWYGGTEAGNAYCNLLFGKVNPSGKLPMTFPAKWEDTPVAVLDDYKPMTCDYKENVFVGYRWYAKKGIKPLFPFGFGLSYTSFKISDLKMEDNVSDGKVFRCSALVENTGKKAGAEVVQLYVEPVEIKGIARPAAELKGFEKVYLEPGESKRVYFELDDRAFACFHPGKRVWYAAKGEYGIRVGNSSDNLPLRMTFRHEGWEAKP